MGRIEGEALRAEHTGGATVEVRGLTRTFVHGGRTLSILRGIDFTLQPGEMVAVVGASGAGKSTLLHILGTLDLPTTGQVLIDGVDVTRLADAELAGFRNRSIGFVFQFHHLLPEFTALENTMMPALIQRVPFGQAERRARAVLTEVGLAERTTHKPGELSGGEQQRVALARALVLEPALLLADEPTGNLDTHTGEQVHELLYDISRARGTTMLIVTHNPQLAKRMPRRLHMIDGRLAQEGDA
jgi:lipoprotein-releasing system ATP-binding protein